MLGDGFGDLLDAARDGDQVAFEALWRDVNPALVKYLRVLVPDAADDVAAETWVSVVAGLRRFSGDETSWRGWLFTIARRRAVDEIRRLSRQPVSRIDPTTLDGSAFPHAPDSAQEALQYLDTRAALELVTSLPQMQAEVIMLRVVAGLPAERVARMLHRTPGAVRVAAHRGLQTLAKAMAAVVVTQ